MNDELILFKTLLVGIIWSEECDSEPVALDDARKHDVEYIQHNRIIRLHKAIGYIAPVDKQ